MDAPALDWLAPAQTEKEDRADGSFVLRSKQKLQPYARCIGDWVEHWAQATPDSIVLAERAGDGQWRKLSWQQLRTQLGAVAQGLLNLQLPPGRPIAILSDNSIDHAVLMLAAMHVGLQPATISSAYSRLSQDHQRLRSILQTLQPALIYASDAATYAKAMQCCDVGAKFVLSQGADDVPGAMAFSQLQQTAETAQVMARFAQIQPDDHAKYLLTSGSTGSPKVVINTHRMLCANQQMMVQVWPFLKEEKPVLLDWLPWSHTFGSNHNFNMVLANGGTMYIDDGRPVPGLIEKTVRNLREVPSTLHFNVPHGLGMLMTYLENDEELARQVLGSLRGVFYAGAALPQSTWERLQKVATRVKGAPLWLTTSWGSTETAPAITSAHFPLEKAGCIGVPLPGLELKFVPSASKLELRVRGVSIFPGYRNAPELTQDAFDEEGFYKIGDAGQLVHPDKPEQGVQFDGRVAEDFKLTTGTWVSVGTLRLQMITALSPLAQDVVITGHDRTEIGALIFLSPTGQQLPKAELRQKIQAALQQLKRNATGSASCPTRALVLDGPPNVATGEITDKGYVNQRSVLSNRNDQVQRLYAEQPDEQVIVLATAI